MKTGNTSLRGRAPAPAPRRYPSLGPCGPRKSPALLRTRARLAHLRRASLLQAGLVRDQYVRLLSLEGSLATEREAHKRAEGELIELRVKYDDLRRFGHASVLRAAMFDGSRMREIRVAVPDLFLDGCRDLSLSSIDARERFARHILEGVLQDIVVKTEARNDNFIYDMLREIALNPELPLRNPRFLAAIRGACCIPEEVSTK